MYTTREVETCTRYKRYAPSVRLSLLQSLCILWVGIMYWMDYHVKWKIRRVFWFGRLRLREGIIRGVSYLFLDIMFGLGL